ncbi:hypothetical protein GE061_009271 [Apolygus lucorum]|uniref:Uncharacterized protein n=1 Tax=Apolygus lucorum TaxID=248454 RepID=A0A8S9Y1T7_APOLU|nr:hypothetical protein GE061_009271 [Apolygus lucorum]
MDMFVRNSIQSRFFNSANNYNYMFGNMDFSKNTDMYDMNNSNYMYGPYSPEYMYGSMFYPYFYTNKPNYFYRPYFHQLMNTLMPYNMGTSDYMYRPFSLEYMNGYMPNFMNMRYPYYMSNNAMNNYFDYQTNRPYPNKLMFGNINNFQNMFYPFDKEYEYFITPQVMNFKNTLYPFQNYMNEYNFPYMPYSLEYMDGLTEHFKNMGVRLSNYMNDYDYMYRMYSPEYVHFQKVYNQFKGNNLDYMNRPYFPGYLENVVDMSYPTNNMLGFSYTNRPNYLGGNMQGVEYMNRRYFPVHMIRYVNNYRYPFYNGMNMENPFYNMNFGGMNFGANQFPDNTNYMT